MNTRLSTPKPIHDMVAPPREYFCNGCQQFFPLEINYWGEFALPRHNDGWEKFTGGEAKPCKWSGASMGPVVYGIPSRIEPSHKAACRDCSKEA